MARHSPLWVALVLAFCLLVSVLATPVPEIHDLHATSLDLYALEDSNTGGRFAVRVERIDQVVDMDAEQESALAANSEDVRGTLLAARVADVIVMFEITPTGVVSVNGQVVPMGMSNLQVEADVVTGVTADGEKLSEDQLTKAFDVGLVGMKVLVEGEKDHHGVSHLVISEVVTEINGEQVAQRNVMQQLVDIFPNGEISYRKPCGADQKTIDRMEDEPHGHGHGHGHHGKQHGHGGPYGEGRHHGQCMGRKLSAWLRSLPRSQRIFVATLFGVALTGFVAAVAAVMVKVIRRATSCQAPAYTAVLLSEDAADAVMVNVEKDEKLPVYDSKGYTQVVSDEKK
ncbi:hypothetical protein HKX48_006548 [Thoreauomyces humboldtii]|nr:hypothetical protein HKX48_006548 [Thoreauomyces humboldtii]